MGIISNIKSHPIIKRKAIWMLIPSGESRPRWWVKKFLNPFYHQRGKGVIIRSTVRMDVLPFRNFEIGFKSLVEDFSVINNGMGDVYIGSRTFIGLSNVIIGPVSIGNNVIMAQNVVLSGLNHGYKEVNMPIRDQPCTTAEIVIGDDTWIGANVTITAGVTIGRHVVIAGGSVVTKSVGEYCVVAGNPARVIKKYDSNLGQWIKIQA